MRVKRPNRSSALKRIAAFEGYKIKIRFFSEELCKF